ncbi:16S rRNA (guanine(966)-N(2))-methyltransferase RsmD [Atopobacter phocae]|uniref:16S rRNA (guanine(966)-N(2))-methyltransferase RsmD n=1 Tax=Atopobacter phocae TaxID=136492 RepID=UPI00047136FE|nr:16S rRNA (guanine(966)-N(2))-methyltransferase RsmD [Atopobacter phocae]
MQIIAGMYKNRKIQTLEGQQTRPTSAKVKESLFQMIGPFFEGGRMLDMFGGSGAVAFEALSRGMDEVVIIEKNRKAQQIISNNQELLKANVSLIKGDARYQLNKVDGTFNFVFIDPPYDLVDIKKDLMLLSYHKLLKEDALICCETDLHTEFPTEVPQFEWLTTKKYKRTQLVFYRFDLSKGESL